MWQRCRVWARDQCQCAQAPEFETGNRWAADENSGWNQKNPPPPPPTSPTPQSFHSFSLFHPFSLFLFSFFFYLFINAYYFILYMFFFFFFFVYIYIYIYIDYLEEMDLERMHNDVLPDSGSDAAGADRCRFLRWTPSGESATLSLFLHQSR